MDREGNDSDDEDEANREPPVSSQVFEYYKNYSCSKQLHRYLRGSFDPISCRTANLSEEQVPKILVENADDCMRDPSPASSVTSNRKLEWDNGADIGYDNCEMNKTLQKSSSFPLLTSESKMRMIDQEFVMKPDNRKSKTVNDSALSPAAEISTKRISSPASLKDKIILLDPNTAGNKEIMHFIRLKIGSPTAQSTPFTRYDTDDSDTQSTTKTEEKADGSPRSTPAEQKKVVSLCLTKPVLVECIGDMPPSPKEVVQTPLPKNSMMYVQKEPTLKLKIVLADDGKVDNEPQPNIVHLKHPESEKEDATNSPCAQTDSDVVISNCNSFEYLYGDDYNENLNKNKQTEKPLSQTRSSVLRRSRAKLDLTAVSTSNTNSSESTFNDSSNDLPLSKLLSKRHLKNLPDDFDKSIGLLRMLIKSKKYDEVTKKYFLKKVMEKLGQIKYTDDASENSADKVDDENGKLNDNKPWLPAHSTLKNDDLIVPVEKHPQLDTSTFPHKMRRMKKNPHTSPTKRFPFTLAYSTEEKSTSPSSDNKLNKSKQQAVTTTATTTTNTDSSMEKSSKADLSWKDRKTKSEILLEKKASGDYIDNSSQSEGVLSYASKEREHQLTWINNEITHLSKLKELLQKHCRSKEDVLDAVLHKPESTNYKGKRKKSTTVYMITTENPEQPKSNKRNFNNQNVMSHNCLRECKQNKKMNFRAVNEVTSRKCKCCKCNSLTTSNRLSGTVELSSDDCISNVKIDVCREPSGIVTKECFEQLHKTRAFAEQLSAKLDRIDDFCKTPSYPPSIKCKHCHCHKKPCYCQDNPLILRERVPKLTKGFCDKAALLSKCPAKCKTIMKRYCCEVPTSYLKTTKENQEAVCRCSQPPTSSEFSKSCITVCMAPEVVRKKRAGILKPNIENEIIPTEEQPTSSVTDDTSFSNHRDEETPSELPSLPNSNSAENNLSAHSTQTELISHNAYVQSDIPEQHDSLCQHEMTSADKSTAMNSNQNTNLGKKPKVVSIAVGTNDTVSIIDRDYSVIQKGPSIPDTDILTEQPVISKGPSVHNVATETEWPVIPKDRSIHDINTLTEESIREKSEINIVNDENMITIDDDTPKEPTIWKKLSIDVRPRIHHAAAVSTADTCIVTVVDDSDDDATAKKEYRRQFSMDVRPKIIHGAVVSTSEAQTSTGILTEDVETLTDNDDTPKQPTARKFSLDVRPKIFPKAVSNSDAYTSMGIMTQDAETVTDDDNDDDDDVPKEQRIERRFSLDLRPKFLQKGVSTSEAQTSTVSFHPTGINTQDVCILTDVDEQPVIREKFAVDVRPRIIQKAVSTSDAYTETEVQPVVVPKVVVTNDAYTETDDDNDNIPKPQVSKQLRFDMQPKIIQRAISTSDAYTATAVDTHDMYTLTDEEDNVQKQLIGRKFDVDLQPRIIHKAVSTCDEYTATVINTQEAQTLTDEEDNVSKQVIGQKISCDLRPRIIQKAVSTSDAYAETEVQPIVAPKVIITNDAYTETDYDVDDIPKPQVHKQLRVDMQPRIIQRAISTSDAYTAATIDTHDMYTLTDEDDNVQKQLIGRKFDIDLRPRIHHKAVSTCDEYTATVINTQEAQTLTDEEDNTVKQVIGQKISCDLRPRIIQKAVSTSDAYTETEVQPVIVPKAIVTNDVYTETDDDDNIPKPQVHKQLRFDVRPRIIQRAISTSDAYTAMAIDTHDMYTLTDEENNAQKQLIGRKFDIDLRPRIIHKAVSTCDEYTATVINTQEAQTLTDEEDNTAKQVIGKKISFDVQPRIMQKAVSTSDAYTLTDIPKKTSSFDAQPKVDAYTLTDVEKIIPKDIRTHETQTDTPISSSIVSSELSSYCMSTSSVEEIRSCVCCKKQYIPNYTFTSYNGFGNYLCRPCYIRNQHYPQPSYLRTGHTCNCYSIVPKETIKKIKQTVKDLNTLEKCNRKCKCNEKKKESNSCTHLKRKVKYCHQYRKGVAYTLTLESDSGDMKLESTSEERKRLQEIKIKVPHPPREKKRKDEENKRKSMENVAKENGENASKESTSKENGEGEMKPSLTVQDYLQMNRPNFIESAEERRKSLIQLAYMREERCQKYKQLLAMSNGLPLPSKFGNGNYKPIRVFSSKEMKQMTEKKYKKLPEVQQKLLDNRDKQIKKANRLLADIFNKKLRANVLKGRTTLATRVSVISLV